jgi:hypothetical protein
MQTGSGLKRFCHLLSFFIFLPSIFFSLSSFFCLPYSSLLLHFFAFHILLSFFIFLPSIFFSPSSFFCLPYSSLFLHFFAFHILLSFFIFLPFIFLPSIFFSLSSFFCLSFFCLPYSSPGYRKEWKSRSTPVNPWHSQGRFQCMC